MVLVIPAGFGALTPSVHHRAVRSEGDDDNKVATDNVMVAEEFNRYASEADTYQSGFEFLHFLDLEVATSKNDSSDF